MTGARHLTDDLWWHVYPLGAVGAPIRDGGDREVVHRLPRLLPWVERAAELGFTGLQLGPVFDSSTHGYDTVDHDRVDPRLGDVDDLVDLIARAHALGMRVMLDGVFNHVGAEHPLYRRALAEGPGSDAARLFRIDWDAAGGPRAASFEGHESLVALNHDEPAVADLVTGVMNRWLDAGADAWRLDAAYAVPAEFWARVLPRVRTAHPDVTVIGEVIHGDYVDVVTRSGMDGVTQYELWKAIWSSIGDANLFELAWALDRHTGFVEHFRPMTFVGNHDVTRIATRVGDRGAMVALAVLMTVGGSPSVYYGDEDAYRGAKTERLGGDDEVRPPLPDSPADLSALGAWMVETTRTLVGLRRRHPWLADARTAVLELANERMVYRSTSADGTRSLDVTLDLTQDPAVTVTGGAEPLHLSR
ncbi:alpha-amylase family protein [Isoptericola sp. b441]|uniref:Alpha-amylase family protein n=1 Tax=Actinotalea lenta TaxID=3064654 RepID=A0ABT9DAF7_9CELL|nr:MULTISPECIES: alpha-amylase family protein [unclassified Isoptericola]MDO8106286.1 alpha-amylase family protein [Isoptericola sp. b441]MDO8121994.1 alpha-amylase family protein [Isoptericola sp. b490]